MRVDFEGTGPAGSKAHAAFVHLVRARELLIVDLDQSRVVARETDYSIPEGWDFSGSYTDTYSEIEGFRCRLVKVGGLTDPGELLWWSDQLQIVVADNPSGGRVEYRVFDVRLREVDEELFKFQEDVPGSAPAIFDPRLR